MEDIRKIKILINRLQKECDLDAKTIADVLNGWHISLTDFLTIMGLNLNLVEKEDMVILNKLIASFDTIISYNPDRDDLSRSEISFYSRLLGINYALSAHKAVIGASRTKEDQEFIYVEEEYKSNRQIADEVEMLHFDLTATIPKKESEQRILSHKYRLNHMKIEIIYRVFAKTIRLSYIIDKDMLASDLEYIKRLLYNFDISKAIKLLEEYPTLIKIMQDEVNLHNFANR